MEEMVKGAAPAPEEGAYIAEKKSFWGRSKKNKTLTRRKSTGKQALESAPNLRPQFNQSGATSKTSIGPDQHARIQAAAIQLQQRQRELDSQQQSTRRGRNDTDLISQKTSSVFTLQPVIMSEASPAMKWANKYDKDAIREAYLANANHGRGLGEATMQTNGHQKSQDTLRPLPNQRQNSTERDLPAVPNSGPEVPAKPTTPEVIYPHTPTSEHVNLSEKGGQAAPSHDTHPAITGPSSPAYAEQPSVDLSRPSAENSGSSPESKNKHNKLKKKDPSGFRKMFGRNKKKDAAPPQVAHKEIPSNNGLQPGGATIGRRFSGFRKKSPVVPQFAEAAPVSARISEDNTTPIASPNNMPHSYDPSERSLSRIDTNDAHEAHAAFSSFDQGPLEDVPAFVPEDSPRQSEDDAAPPPISRIRSTEDGGELTPELSPPVVDRWAQIRKNAAERAAQRQSEEQSRGGYSQKTDGDDGETSGEETIESRVARIKARVAELTGNMESGATNPVSPPINRPTRRA
jgi:hypothetical protein